MYYHAEWWSSWLSLDEYGVYSDDDASTTNTNPDHIQAYIPAPVTLAIVKA